ncbi:sodium-dependent glucose transporter 1B-like [Brevipalpus obovatus]|uniref:sodium-dependent glucose transporter 1B-like n=1 Tax=Brevipalpus obovatus TaxID=246614 RepID=UPI003D9F27CC
MMFSGFASAVFETVTYVALIDIWGKSVGNYMQILYLSFGVGGLVTPILIRPFQLPIPEEIIDPDAYLAYYKPEDVQMKYPLFAEAILSVLIGITFFLYHLATCRSSSRIKTEEHDQKDDKNVENIEGEEKKIPKFKIFIAVAWVAFLGHTGFSMQLIFNVFAQAYGVKSKLRMEKRRAALITTTYWIAVSIGELCFICFSNLVGEKFLSICCTTLLSIGLLLSLTLANTYEICYWLVALFIGLGFGPLFVVAFSYLEKFFHITGKHTSFVCVVFIIGESFHIPMVGAWIDQYPDIFLYYYGILGVLFVIGFASLGYACELLFGKPEEARLQEISQKPRNSFVMIPITERRESVVSYRKRSVGRGQV